MGSDLLVLLVLAVAPTANDLPVGTSTATSQAVSSRRSQVSRPLAPSLASAAATRPRIANRDAQLIQVAAQIPGLATPNVVPTQTPALTPSAISTPNVALPSEIATAGSCSCEACEVPRHAHHSVWGVVGLPSPHYAPGDMTQHIPYIAHPHNFYYFRPYNYFHIPKHQAEVAYYGGNPKHPYANRLFERVYDRTVDSFEQDQSQPEPITPLRLR